jgi:DNA processing protein
MSNEHIPDLKYWLGFNLVKGIGPAKVQALIDYFGNLEAAWQASEPQLHKIGLDRRTIQTFLEMRATINLDVELARLDEQGIRLLVWDSPGYPRY